MGIVGISIRLVTLLLFPGNLAHGSDNASQIASARRGEHATSFLINFKGMANVTKIDDAYRVLGPAGVIAVVANSNQNGFEWMWLRRTPVSTWRRY